MSDTEDVNPLTGSITHSIILRMTKADKQLNEMRNNPRDWRIDSLVSIAERYGVEVRNHGGSHHIFSFLGIELAISVPAHRPIKPIYIKQFIALLDLVKGIPS